MVGRCIPKVASLACGTSWVGGDRGWLRSSAAPFASADPSLACAWDGRVSAATSSSAATPSPTCMRFSRATGRATPAPLPPPRRARLQPSRCLRMQANVSRHGRRSTGRPARAQRVGRRGVAPRGCGNAHAAGLAVSEQLQIRCSELSQVWNQRSEISEVGVMERRGQRRRRCGACA